MLKLCRLAFAATLAASFVGAATPVWAGTPDEAKALADKAAALIVAEGERAFPKINDPAGEFVQGDLFVAVLDKDVVVRATGVNPKLIGVNMADAVDPDGFRFSHEAVRIAQAQGSGWITYRFTNPSSKKIEPKRTWVAKAGEFTVLCGAYVSQQ